MVSRPEYPCGGKTIHYCFLSTPLGRMLLAGDDVGLCYIGFPSEQRTPESHWREDRGALQPVIEQLQGYFAGTLSRFQLALNPSGTPFQLQVWQALQEIPYGQTWSYGQLAWHIGRPTASRAVGAANGANPLPIVIPCHRVIGSNGNLVGFGGGLPLKRWLLDHEGVMHQHHREQLHLPGL